MRRLHPPDESDHARPVEELYAGLTLASESVDAPGATPRAWVALDMVSSIDGAATVYGTTERLGGEADGIAFGRLRAACDALLVGAGTVRVENYGPPKGSTARQEDRRARGLRASPQLVVVTGTLDLSPQHRALSDPAHPPLVVTHADAPAEREATLRASGAEVVRLGDHRVDLRRLLELLHERGLGRVLCEGGPTLNGTLLERGLVDEIFLTVTPVVVAGDGPRMVDGHALDPLGFELTHVHEHAGELLLRYRAIRGARPSAG